MPTYSYRCSECGEAFDIQQAFTDDTLTVCPNCGGKLRKLFNTVGVTFNGSGFYRNDSRAPAPSEGGSGGTGDSGGSGDSSGSSDSSSSSSPSTPAAPATTSSDKSKSASTSTSKGTSKIKSKKE
jgi:putative FmdB family regulatory protein